MQLQRSSLASEAIRTIKAYQIFDSRGKPTVEVALTLNSGEVFRAAVPSGASTGTHEALELRDNGKEYLGADKLKASSLDLKDQKAVDKFLLALDGTENKSNLGANAILGVSMACCMAGACLSGLALHEHIRNLYGRRGASCIPHPYFNIINGGAHAGNTLAFQEFMIVPNGAGTFRQAMQIGTEVYHHLKKIIKEAYGQDAINVGDEGGFAPDVASPSDCLDLILKAIEVSGHSGKVDIALDVAASEFYQDGKYNLDIKCKTATEPRILTGKQLAELYRDLAETYPIVSIEDPFDQDDWESWTYLRSILPRSVQIVGDDLTVTNPKRIAMSIEKFACNALLLKINQIGTIWESLEAAKLAQTNGWNVMVSHRSGETENHFIADLAVGIGCGQLKSGAPCRSERLAKYNQLLRIEAEDGISLC